MKNYQWGIISTAKIGRNAMIPALKASQMADVAAVGSRTQESAQRFADALGIPRAYGSYQAVLDDPQIDAVYIPLPNHLHKEWSIKAAEAGKHILCEKPLALNTEECRKMIDAANANGVLLMESFMYRHHPRIIAAKEMVQKGAIGKLGVIEAAFTFVLKDKNDIRYQPEMGGGALLDVGCYCVNIIRLMAGREPVTVQGRAVWAPSGVDDQLTGILDFGDGLMAHFDCAFTLKLRQRCIVAGTEGYLGLPMAFTPGLDKTEIVEKKGGLETLHSFEGVDEYRLIAEEFMRAIPGGKAPYPAEDALANMQVLQALLTSAKHDGKPVKI